MYVAPRMCGVIDENGEPQSSGQDSATPLTDFADVAAYVLIAEPGAGKTTAFETEAQRQGAVYVTVRNFLTYEDKPEWHGATLFLDGLDELRVGTQDGRTPLDGIRAKLRNLECPSFRLSCRWADWLAANDKEALRDVAANGILVVIRLEPLSRKNIKTILANNHDIEDPDGFIAAARERGVQGLLSNPQNLKMLATVVSQGQWPGSRKETLEQACRLLIREENQEHRAADPSISDEEALLEAAGRLCAVQLLSGAAGYTLPGRAEPDDAYPSVAEVNGATGSLERKALATRLFVGVAEGRLAPEHRGIAEFLAARHIAGLLNEEANTKALPLARVLSLITGFDGQMLPSFWNFVSWLAVHHKPSRGSLSRLNPSGLIHAGDAQLYSVDEKQNLVRDLRREASWNPWCSRTLSRTPGIGRIVSPELEGTFREILTDSERRHEHQSYVMLLLQMLADGEPLPALAEVLQEQVRDPSWNHGVRCWALDTLVNYSKRGQLESSILEAMVDDINGGSIDDPQDGLLGILLKALYPNDWSMAQVERHFREPKHPDAHEYIGFWMNHVLRESTPQQLAALLDGIAARFEACRPFLIGEAGRYTGLGQLPLNLLGRVLRETACNFSIERLYTWLRVVSEPGLQVPDHQKASLRFSLERNQDALKALIDHSVGACLCTGEELTGLIDRHLLGARPRRYAPWCLEMALAAEDSRAAYFYVEELVEGVADERRADRLTVEAARAGLATNKSLVRQFDQVVQARAGDDSLTPSRGAVDSRATISTPEDTAEQRDWQIQVVAQEGPLRARCGSPQLLHQAAEAYLGLRQDFTTKTPSGRLRELVGSRADLIDPLVTGLETAITRPDLPSCDEVVRLFDRGLVNSLVLPFVAGLHSMEQSDALSVRDLNERQIRLAVTLLYMLARNVVDPDCEDATGPYRPNWFQTLLLEDPVLVADIVSTSSAWKLETGVQPLVELRELAKAEDHRKVAEIASLSILESFPNAETEAALTALCWTLKAALTNCEWSDVGRLIDNRFGKPGQGAAERSCWLAAGYLIEPERFRKHLSSLAESEDENGLEWLARFVAKGRFPQKLTKRFTAADFGPFIGAMGAALRLHGMPERAYWATADVIAKLGNDPRAIATETLKTLASTPDAEPWAPAIAGATDRQAGKRREQEYRYQGVRQVVQTLNNGSPASAGDLAALVFHELDVLRSKIRHGNTSDWRQYWNVDSYNRPERPKPEDACRDAVLSDLRERLERLEIDAQPEGIYANDKRSDIRVGFRGFNVPVEIKRSCHEDLWTAIHSQLIPKYTRDRGAAGYGIYLVFWFGDTEHCRPTRSAGWSPETAEDVKQRVEKTLSDWEERLISVCVVDVSPPLKD